MATTTPNLALTKPAGTEYYDISVQNANMDKIDTAVAARYEKPLRFFDITVSTSSWNSDATYPDYPRRKSVALTGVTSAMVPDVVLAPADATGGNIAPVAVAYNGGIYLYAKETPTASITIPTITIWRAV